MFYCRPAPPCFSVPNVRQLSNWSHRWTVTWRNVTLMWSMTTGSSVRNVQSVTQRRWRYTTISWVTTIQIGQKRNESVSQANVNNAPIALKYSKMLAGITATATRNTSTTFAKSGSFVTLATHTFPPIEPSSPTRLHQPVTRKSLPQHFNANFALKVLAGNTLIANILNKKKFWWKNCAELKDPRLAF